MINETVTQCKSCEGTWFFDNISPVTGLCPDCTDKLVKGDKKVVESTSREIVTSNVTPEMGQALIKAGVDARQKKLTEQCVGTVEQLLSQIAIAEQNIKFQSTQIEVYRKRLNAIEKGEIEIVPNGQNLKIVYKDKGLSPEELNY